MTEIELPGDKSLTHRYLIFASLAKGQSTLQNLPLSSDTEKTLQILQSLGTKTQRLSPSTLELEGGQLTIQGKQQLFDCGNSGTTMRLMCGVLPFFSSHTTLTGDESLMKRPMARIVDPLKAWGVAIDCQDDGRAPIHIRGGANYPLGEYHLPIASAQVKTALLLFSLLNEKETALTGKTQSRNHTEVFLKFQKLNINTTEQKIVLNDSYKNLKPFNVEIPGDPSSAAFLIALRLLCPGPALILRNFLNNPTRSGYLSLLQEMGAMITQSNQRNVLGEEVCDLKIEYTDRLQHNFVITKERVPSLIDELPILSLIFKLIPGETRIEGTEELAHKESNRNQEIQNLLNNPEEFQSQDHRMLMTRSIYSIVQNKEFKLTQAESEAIQTSYPNFERDIRTILEDK